MSDRASSFERRARIAFHAQMYQLSFLPHLCEVSHLWGCYEELHFGRASSEQKEKRVERNKRPKAACSLVAATIYPPGDQSTYF